MITETKTQLRKFLLKKFPTNEYFDCPVSKEQQELMIEFAESKAKQVVEKIILINDMKHINDLAEKKYRDYPDMPKGKDWKYNKDVNAPAKRKAFVAGAIAVINYINTPTHENNN